MQAISPPRAEARQGRRRPAQGGKGAGPQAVQVERARGALACRAERRARRFRTLGRGSRDARGESLQAGRSGGVLPRGRDPVAGSRQAPGDKDGRSTQSTKRARGASKIPLDRSPTARAALMASY